MNYQKLYEQENKLIRNYGYKDNNLMNSQRFMFNFINGKFYWRELMKINTKSIERSSDISSIYPYMQNILYTRLNLENIDLLSEEYIIQLVTLLQLLGQYLIFSQKILEQENNELKIVISKLRNKVAENEEYKRIIDNLNRQNQENEYLIKTYQDMIQNGKAGSNINDEDDKNINLKSVPEINYVQKTYYYCNICLGKKFKTQKYLDEHMKRRHYNQQQLININKEEEEEKKVEEDNYRLEFEDRLNTMRNEFMNLIKQKEENDEFAILNKKLELLQVQMMSQNYNNIINYKNNLNYYNKKYNKSSSKIERKDKSQNELKQKYDELNKKYNELKIKFEEKKKIEIDFNRQTTYLEEKKEKKDENEKQNKNINIIEKNINIQFKPIETKIDIANKKKETEKKIDNDEAERIKVFNFDKDFINEQNKEEENKNKLKDKKDIENEILLNNKVNIYDNVENDPKKFLTNDGNETFIQKPQNSEESKNEENKHSINNKSLNDSRMLFKKLQHSREMESDVNESENTNSKNSEKPEEIIEKKPSNDEDKIIPLIGKNKEEDKLNLFYKQVKERDKNCLKEEINKYKKIEIVEEPSIELNQLLKGKQYSEEYIKNYKNFDYLDKELGLIDLLKSYKKIKNNRNENPTIVKNTSMQNNGIGKNSHFLKASIGNNIIEENPYKSKIEKNNEVIESSFIKGFDLIRSTNNL